MAMNRILFYFICVFSILCMSSDLPSKDCTPKNTNESIKKWVAGEKVSLKEVEAYGIDNCFVSEKISDNTFRRMWKKSYKEGCSISRNDLRYLKVLHYTADGSILLGELVCNKLIAQDLLDIFRKLFDAKYAIEKMILIDKYNADDETSMNANNTSCFNFRKVKGSKNLSKHSRGLAIDINPRYNPCVKKKKNGTFTVQPSSGKSYTYRTKSFPYKISQNDLCYKLFIEKGFKWGGIWKYTKDYQHFEKIQ